MIKNKNSYHLEINQKTWFLALTHFLYHLIIFNIYLYISMKYKMIHDDKDSIILKGRCEGDKVILGYRGQHQASIKKHFRCMKSYLSASDLKSDSHVSYIADYKGNIKIQKRTMSRLETDSRHNNFRAFFNMLKTIGIQN